MMEPVTFCSGLVNLSVKNVMPISKKHTQASIVSHVLGERKNLNFFFIDFP